MYLTFYIPASRISNIKVGQSVRYTASQNLAKPLVLIGKVKKIDTAPTPIHEISYVKVSAKIDPTKSQLSKIHYGLQGKSVIIVDKKTWFNYFKDKVLNN
ncbi:HlyD family efflux transporter periplasmic adaptor subunit [Lactiplantibacillus pentosus]|uniref:HlyD family efflux transporter periplasmic adaptor subunit n=1 Tax=Lactiplantibacillus pentosus TaxID=1589 RepID=UPI0015E5A1AB|nr:HlyD family efflux transporter periplasmic adaptor subunit [Lactiplantibacillus pentosus]